MRQRESERERRREGEREIKLQVWCGKRLNMSRMVVWEDVYIVVLHITYSNSCLWSKIVEGDYMP